MAREARRAQIEGRLNRIRASLSRKTHEKPENSNDDSRQEDPELARELSESLRSSSSEQLVRQEKVAKVVEEYKTRREQVRNLSVAMQEKEKLVGQLQADVERLRREMEECSKKAQEDMQKQRATAHDQIDQMEKRVEAKDEQIGYYEFKLRAHEKAIEELRLELGAARRKAAEVELQLEVHDFKFSSYEDYPRQLEKQALEKIGEDVVSVASHDESEDTTQQYIRKLI
jgi:chromosome segregation ATPase